MEVVVNSRLATSEQLTAMEGGGDGRDGHSEGESRGVRRCQRMGGRGKNARRTGERRGDGEKGGGRSDVGDAGATDGEEVAVRERAEVARREWDRCRVAARWRGRR